MVSDIVGAYWKAFDSRSSYRRSSWAAVHGLCGLAGALLTGTFAEQRFTPWGDNGLAFGNPAQLYENAVGAFAALGWCMGITAAIIKIMDVVWPGGIRVTPKEEEIGLDLAQHGERAYVTG
jgi:Amt family ammonium transporter